MDTFPIDVKHFEHLRSPNLPPRVPRRHSVCIQTARLQMTGIRDTTEQTGPTMHANLI